MKSLGGKCFVVLMGLICFMSFCAEPVHAQDRAWTIEYDGGEGLKITSPDEDFQFRQLGYVQFRNDLFHHDFERTDEQWSMGIRRARLDWILDIKKKYQLLLEVDGADGGAAGQSDFDLVVARISGPAWGDATWYAGKFITPFSTENNRSSRALDMIERYTALNSLFLLPALDVQFGAMIEQPVSEKWTLFGGVFNGNGRAADNLSDDNGDKEVQLKVRHNYSDNFTWAISADRTNEESQVLSLEGYSFTDYSSLNVEGTRKAGGISFDYSKGSISFRGEGLYADFSDTDVTLSGGYLQPGYFLTGNSNGGLQVLLRFDYAQINDDNGSINGDSIRTVTAGLNWFVNKNVRIKVNGVGEDYDGAGNNTSPTSGIQGDGFKPYLLSELQFKF